MKGSLILWVGGKYFLRKAVVNLPPTAYGTYWEPFFGGGSVFF